MRTFRAPLKLSLRYSAYSKQEAQQYLEDGSPYPKRLLLFLVLISISLVNPVLTIPFIGLSLYAPLFYIVAIEAIIKPPASWMVVDRKYKVLASIIWIGLFLSLAVNGISSGGVVDTYGILTLIRYAYWLFIFILVIYVITIGRFAAYLTKVFGWSILGLSLIRLAEAFLYSNIGAGTGTRWFSQNGYGFQFSAFSAFLLMLIIVENGWKRKLALIGYTVLLGAAAINGSRGSWVGMGVSLTVFLFIVLLSQPKRFSRLLAMLLLAGSVAIFVFVSSSDQISDAINRRFSTFENLEQEKSYQFRLVMNQKSMLLFEESPIFGVGPGGFRSSSAEGLILPAVYGYANIRNFDGKSSHNSYLGFLAENGLVGSIPFALLLIGLILTGFKSALILSKRNQYWGVAIYAGFIGMSVHMWVISSLTNTATWFVYGLTAAMIILTRAETQKI